MTGRRGGHHRFRREILALAIPGLLLAAVFAATGCGRMPRVIVLEDPLTAGEHLELGVLYERQEKFDLAIREYEQVLRKDEEFFQSRVNLGNIWLARKEYGKARAEYRKALAIRPGDPEATNNLAWAAILSGERREEAAERMEAVLSRQANRTATLLDTLGVLRMRMGQPGRANEAFAEAERLCLEAGGSGCSDEVLREIRGHRAEACGDCLPSAPPPLVK
ncbi:MAG TPA: tetratricopeptide repeat protein [Candidatus Limnocylindria bacterium]|nr:tetratricopeptide repeat protein [Candidatus Limnocylindria bacterium]